MDVMRGGYLVDYVAMENEKIGFVPWMKGSESLQICVDGIGVVNLYNSDLEKLGLRGKK